MTLKFEPPYIDTGIASSFRLAGIGLTYAFLSVWVKYVIAPRPLGASRLLWSLPILAVNFVCPWIFNVSEEVLQRLSTVFIFTWLCTFKMLAFCWGRPPLQDSMTVTQIAVVTMLPLFPKPPESGGPSGPRGRLQDSAGSGAGLAARWFAKIALLGAVVYLVIQYGDSMPGALRHYTYAFGLYAFVGFLMDGPAALAVEALGVQVIPTFDQPWMSASLAEFWGRRWNIPTTSVLRTVVYDTIMDGSFIHPARLHDGPPPGTAGSKAPAQTQNGREKASPSPSPAGPAKKRPLQQQQQAGEKEQQQQQQHQQHQQQQGQGQPRWPKTLRRQLGLHATFLVSGVVHEYIAWLVSMDGSVGWKWTVFFYLQAPLLTLETVCLQRLRRAGISLPRPLAILLTLIVLEAVAYDLFFGFVESDTDIAPRVVRAVSSSFRALMAPLQPLLAASLGAGR